MKNVKLKPFKVKLLTISKKHVAATSKNRNGYWNFQGFYGKSIQGGHIFILKHFYRFLVALMTKNFLIAKAIIFPVSVITGI